jgi:hypothetical protein
MMEIEIQQGTAIIFANKDYARKLLRKNDCYTSLLSEFDLQSKIQTTSNAVKVKDYLEISQMYLLDWTEEEIELLTNIVNKTKLKIEELMLSFKLPKEIFLIKSTMQEEGDAEGFTRNNYIVFNYKDISDDLFQHELFHIISRYNPKIKNKLFSSIGFRRCNEIRIPEELAHLKITNPDAPYNNYFIKVVYKGNIEDAFMFIYAIEKYKGGSFFDYMITQLILIEGSSKDKRIKRNENGEFISLDYDEVDNLFEQIGTNTEYNIHPEEICAEHFTLLLQGLSGLPNQELITKMKSILKASQ